MLEERGDGEGVKVRVKVALRSTPVSLTASIVIIIVLLRKQGLGEHGLVVVVFTEREAENGGKPLVAFSETVTSG